MESDLSSESRVYLKNTDPEYRKIMGQYFTPKKVREELVKLLPKNLENPLVLDPACGSGEFLRTAKDYFINPRLEGWEVDKTLVDISKKLVPGAKITRKDSLRQKTSQKYDVVIGNPPYFELKPDMELKKRYGQLMGGRSNIFGFFVQLGIDLLKDGGYLGYVIPPSMNNGAYFDKLRRYIVKHTNIETIKILNTNMFEGAQQLTMLMVLKKTKNKGKYLFEVDGVKIFSENWQYLREEFKGKKSLRDLGFRVKTGRVVWNQNKDMLTNDVSKTPLIWSHNIGEDGRLTLNNKPNKFQYIDLSKPDFGPALVVNRITGAANSAKIRVAKIPAGLEFFAENHTNVIFPPKGIEGKKAEKMLVKIQNQLRSKEKLKIFQSITGNTQISKNELEKLFPIDPLL